jgi:hypothetical protein
LVFEYDGNIGWTIRNVGMGPALNVVVAQVKRDNDWSHPVRIPPLQKDGQMVLKWVFHVNSTGFGATYTDFENLPYSSTCRADLSKVFKGLRFGPFPESQIRRHWDDPPYFE